VIRELSAAIILFTSETKVISVLIFDLNESGDLGAIAVLGIIMLVITFAVVIAINRIPASAARGCATHERLPKSPSPSISPSASRRSMCPPRCARSASTLASM
jgi:hypothetical protein